MAIIVRILLRFGGLVAVKRCSPGLSRDSLVQFVISKWQRLQEHTFTLTYMLDGVGECLLDDDEAMSSMFDMVTEASLDRVEVIVKEKKVELVGANPFSVEKEGFPLVLYDNNAVVNEGIVEGVPDKAMGSRLLSADWAFLIKDVGQVFEGGVREFRKSLIKFSIEMGFEFSYVKNEPTRVTAECRFKTQSQCPWRIHASVDKSNDYCYIRTYNKQHQCGMFFGTASKKRLNSKVILDLIVNDVRAMPGITPVEVQSQVKDKFGVDISYWIAWRSTDEGKKRIFGDESSSYSYLPAYFEEAARTNPGSVFHLEIDDEKKTFQRCFFAFEACLVGFKFCRPVVMIDGTFLKSRHKGVLLSAVGKDADEGLFPIAFAIVSEETVDNWAWFLNHFREAIGDDRKLNFVSDRNAGIIRGVGDIFPDCLHSYCYKHLQNNLKHRFRGVASTLREAVLNQFAACTYATTKEEFGRCIEKLLATGGHKVRAFLDDLPKEKWSNVYCEGQRYGQMTSNGCESWNGQIKKKRHLPITSLIDGIRRLLMGQMCKRGEDGNKWTTVLSKNTEKRLKDLVEKGRSWVFKRSSITVFEVLSAPNAVVDLGEKTCSCKLWQINGFPCAHAAAVIFLNLRAGTQGYDYIDQWYHKANYKQCYAGSVVPFVLQPEDLEVAVIRPPEFKPTRGRPKRKRIPSQGEFVPRKMTCSRCNTRGNHNKKTCRK